MRHRWLRRALEDWRAIMEFNASLSPTHARNVVHAVERALDVIRDNPEIGIPTRLDRSIRGWYVKTGALWIFYVPTHDTIEIRRVRPARARPLRSSIDY